MIVSSTLVKETGMRAWLVLSALWAVGGAEGKILFKANFETGNLS